MDVSDIIKILTADYPPAVWYVPSLVLVVLALTALYDARTGRVPDLPIALGFLGAICSLAWAADWFVAGERFLYALAAVIVLRLANNLYFKLFHRDAFGFGDAKWTGLAVAGFGIIPVCWAWGIGAWLALIWLGLRRVIAALRTAYDGEVYVHFAPFLLLGLVASLFKRYILLAFT